MPVGVAGEVAGGRREGTDRGEAVEAARLVVLKDQTAGEKRGGSGAPVCGKQAREGWTTLRVEQHQGGSLSADSDLVE